jgi:hypothetical protein
MSQGLRHGLRMSGNQVTRPGRSQEQLRSWVEGVREDVIEPLPRVLFDWARRLTSL